MLIIFAVWIAPHFERPGIVLAIGVFVAGLVQLLFMLPFLAAVRMVPVPRWGWRDPGVRRIVRLTLPVIFGSSAAQISILFDTLIASFLMTGSISWLYFSDRLIEFPLGVFGIALATVIMPNLSRQHASQSSERFASTLDWALRLAILIAAPAAVGLFVLAGPMLGTIFYGGLFNANDVNMARLSLMAYSAGLLGFTLVKVLAPGYFARQEPRQAVRFGLVALAVNIVLNIILVVPWVRSGAPGPHAGLALATSVSALLNAGLLYRGLLKAGILRPTRGWPRLLLKVVVACALMALLISYFVPPLELWLQASLLTRCLWLTAAVFGGAMAYVAVLFAVGVRPADFGVKSFSLSA